MQHYKPVSFQTLRYPYDIPIFKTNALRLVSNEGWVGKTSFATIKRLIQPYLSLLWL